MERQADVVREAWGRYSGACPHRTGDESAVRRPGNALNVEVGSTSPRCILQRPEHWAHIEVHAGTATKNAMGLRWLASGGSPFVFGLCGLALCPLRPEFCADCGHRKDAGHVLGGTCRTESSGPGGSWPCGCEAFRAIEARS